MNHLETTASNCLQFPPQDLAELYRTLAKLLAQTGLSAARLNEVLTHHVIVQCSVCGEKLTAEKLEAWAVLDPETAPPDPSLARLRLGYCAKVGCESWRYNLEVTDCPGVDWSQLLPKIPVKSTSTAKPSASRNWFALMPRFDTKTSIRLGVALAVLLALLFIRYRSNGGRIPLLEPKHNYLLSPNPVATPPSPYR
jgi:hypothetical protein